MQLTPTIFCLAFVLPGLLMAAAGFLGRFKKLGRAAPLLTLVALVAGFTAAYWQLEPAPTWPLAHAPVIQWVFCLAGAVGLIELIGSMLKFPAWLRAIFLLAAVALCCWKTVSPLRGDSLTNPQVALAISIAGLVAVGWWWSMQRLCARAPGALPPIFVAIFCVCCAVVLSTWHIQRSATLAGALTAIAAGSLVGTFFSRSTAQSLALGAILLILLPILFNGYFYSDDAFPPTANVFVTLLLAAPLAALFGELPPIHRILARRGLLRWAFYLLPMIVLAGAAVSYNVHNFLLADQQQASEDE